MATLGDPSFSMVKRKNALYFKHGAPPGSFFSLAYLEDVYTAIGQRRKKKNSSKAQWYIKRDDIRVAEVIIPPLQ